MVVTGVKFRLIVQIVHLSTKPIVKFCTELDVAFEKPMVECSTKFDSTYILRTLPKRNY